MWYSCVPGSVHPFILKLCRLQISLKLPVPQITFTRDIVVDRVFIICIIGLKVSDNAWCPHVNTVPCIVSIVSSWGYVYVASSTSVTRHVIICETISGLKWHNYNVACSLKHERLQWWLYLPTAAALQNCTLCPHSTFMYLISFSN